MLKFALHEKVKLPQEIHDNLKGIIIAIYISDKGTQYLVRYFFECKASEIYFFEWELERYE